MHNHLKDESFTLQWLHITFIQLTEGPPTWRNNDCFYVNLNQKQTQEMETNIKLRNVLTPIPNYNLLICCGREQD